MRDFQLNLFVLLCWTFPLFNLRQQKFNNQKCTPTRLSLGVLIISWSEMHRIFCVQSRWLCCSRFMVSIYALPAFLCYRFHGFLWCFCIAISGKMLSAIRFMKFSRERFPSGWNFDRSDHLITFYHKRKSTKIYILQ